MECWPAQFTQQSWWELLDKICTGTFPLPLFLTACLTVFCYWKKSPNNGRSPWLFFLMISFNFHPLFNLDCAGSASLTELSRKWNSFKQLSYLRIYHSGLIPLPVFTPRTIVRSIHPSYLGTWINRINRTWLWNIICAVWWTNRKWSLSTQLIQIIC